MRILSASVKNFGSYKQLTFDLTNRGLTLISGPTGSGKSTLCDIIPWVLFGRTSKDGAADDVISWNTTGVTEGQIMIEMATDTYLSVSRARGKNGNDFFFVKPNLVQVRGKDLNDTQKLLNQFLALTVETYLAGAYFHEFSQTAQFFITSAKNRRVITEQLADLTLAKKLQENSSAYNKELKEEIATVAQKLLLKESNLSIIKKNLDAKQQKAQVWEREFGRQAVELENKALNFESLKEQHIKELTKKFDAFEDQKQDKISSMKAEIDALAESVLPEEHFEQTQGRLEAAEAMLDSAYCSECGALKDSTKRLMIVKHRHALEKERINNNKVKAEIITLKNGIQTITNAANPYTDQIATAKQQVNDYLDRLEDLTSKHNPHRISAEETLELNALEAEIKDMKNTSQELKIEQSDISLLQEVVDSLRGSIISNTVGYLEQTTNSLLETHFDGEMRITLDVSTSDKLEVGITKDGNTCSYTQLSKGQRQILKLCFGVSVMQAVSNYNGTSFNCAFFDEALDGMDDSTKIKALDLLQALALSFENVLCVEHSEQVKSMFPNKIEVTLENGNSVINE